MNLIDSKVKHPTLGTGTITEQTETRVTVSFKTRTASFEYPKVFASFLTCEDPTIQTAILQEIEVAKAAEEKQKRAEEEAKQRIDEQHAAEAAAKRTATISTSKKKTIKTRERISGKRMTFFVFQGTTYDRESRGGYIWATITNKDGKRVFHWDSLLDVRPGDIILHGVDGYVQAVSTARGECYDCIQPTELSSEELWDRDGRRIDCDYITIRNAIKTSDFVDDIVRLCNAKYAPFDRNGSGNMGYLFEINRDLARIFLRAGANFNPSLKEVEYIQEFLAEDAHA